MLDKNIIIKNALLITLMIGGFFLISKLFGLESNPYLRFFNLIFVLLGIRQAVKASIYKNHETNYATNFGIAFGTAALGVILSTVGVLVYMEFITPEFVETIGDSFLIGGDLSKFEIVFTLFVEGFASSIVGSLIIMQFYKNHGPSEV